VEKQQQYRTLCNKLKTGLMASKDNFISASAIQDFLLNIDVLEAKYRAQLEPKRTKKAGPGVWPETTKQVKKRMLGPAEKERQWCEPPADLPRFLFRAWDAKS
jgi:hypothetical protein